MGVQKFKLVKDKYFQNRGKTAKFLNIYCENCGDFLLLYQKDGPGPLKRLYLDRILFPKNLSDLKNNQTLNNLICQSCKRIIAIPSIYQREERRALALLAYMVIKRVGKGLYPPKITKLELS